MQLAGQIYQRENAQKHQTQKPAFLCIPLNKALKQATKSRYESPGEKITGLALAPSARRLRGVEGEKRKYFCVDLQIGELLRNYILSTRRILISFLSPLLPFPPFLVVLKRMLDNRFFCVLSTNKPNYSSVQGTHTHFIIASEKYQA